MLIPASLSICEALAAVDSVIPNEHHRQFIHFRLFQLRSRECPLIDFCQPSVQHSLSSAVILGVCALPKRTTVTMVLDPPNIPAVPLVDAATAPLALHRSSFHLFLAHRADTALRAITLRSAADSPPNRAFAPFLPIADNSDAERLAALAFPPFLPSATAFGSFFFALMLSPLILYTTYR